MTRAFLLFLLVLFAVRFLWRFMRAVAEGASGPAAPSGKRETSSVHMVRDPVCGTYVVPGKALEIARGREILYFCSDKCRDEFARQ